MCVKLNIREILHQYSESIKKVIIEDLIWFRIKIVLRVG